MDTRNLPFDVKAPPMSKNARTWLAFYPDKVPHSLDYPNEPISCLLEQSAKKFPDRDVCTLYGKRHTYKDINDKAHRLARSLQKFGVGPGQTVGMLLPNIPEYIVAMQATWLTGATVLQLSPLMVPEEMEKWVAMTDCRTVVTLDLLAPSLKGALAPKGALEHLVVTTLAGRLPSWKSWLYWVERVRRKGPLYLSDTKQFHQFENLLPAVEGDLNPKIDSLEDVALLAPTGGTTASPKAVMLTHRNLIANALQLRHWSLEPEGAATVLGVLPFFHAYGLSVCMTCSIAMGATIHLHPRFEIKPVLDLLEKEQIDFMPAVPAILSAFNKELAQNPRDLSFIRAVISGASALSDAVREEFEKSGAHNVVVGYGLSEASPVTHCNPLDDHARPGTIGIPVPDTEAKILDEETGTHEMPLGETGELIVRGPQVMKGYYNNPEETAKCLKNGWLYTGDIARRDKDGYFTIVDRKKDIIKTSGFLVYPAEVEELLSRHPDVAEAAVVGEPDDERGEVIVALVVPRNGNVDMGSLRQHCAEHLSKQKRPKIIEIVKELPKNFLGKIQRRKVREGRTTAT